MKKLVVSLSLSVILSGTASAQLLIDFDNNGSGSGQDNAGAPHTEAGYQSYSAQHEVPGTFVPRDYSIDFTVSGLTTVSVTPAWPNTTDARVQQMIDRGTGNDANWVGNQIDLITDWLGTDSRTGNGGLGNYDGINGTPTYMTLALGGLPAGDYEWVSFHHDTEHMHTMFTVELSTDAGLNFNLLSQGQMTDSTPGGTPDSLNPISGANDPDPRNLPSTVQLSLSANGTDDVLLRFTPLSSAVGVHQQFFGINGFELLQVPEPSTIALLLSGTAFLLLLRRKRQPAR